MRADRALGEPALDLADVLPQRYDLAKQDSERMPSADQNLTPLYEEVLNAYKRAYQSIDVRRKFVTQELRASRVLGSAR